jgi:hypothetical protein
MASLKAGRVPRHRAGFAYPLGMGSDGYAAAVERHYLATWGAPVRRNRLSVGPVHELPATFEVLTFQRHDALCYATQCMSEPTDAARLELHLLARAGFQPELVELMTVVAHFHRTTRLDVGHSVNFGRPWVAGATCSFGLISLPYLDGPALEWMTEPRVRFLWLIPITEQERDFKQVHGVEALEQRFEAGKFDSLDPNRASVA